MHLLTISVRGLEAILGLWLLISAFLWPHTSTQLSSAIVTGTAATVTAFVALLQPRFRYMNTLLGIWLVLSASILPVTTTTYNHLVVGLALFAASLVAGVRPEKTSTGEHP